MGIIVKSALQDIQASTTRPWRTLLPSTSSDEAATDQRGPLEARSMTSELQSPEKLEKGGLVPV
ncbi:hypothetical protein LY78DRAFT_675770 [Colletotrichum sublineola]|nr:hypothetical protein LY78DRAFT_675770 [Colletotrichum sublineola]